MINKASMGSQDRNDAMIAEYVRGTLDDAAVEALELKMLDDPDLLARVEEQVLLQRGLRTVSLEEPAPARSRRWLGYVFSGGLGVALVVIAAWNVRLTSELDELRAPRSAVPVVTLFEERSLLDPAVSLESVNSEGPVLIEVDVSALGDQHFVLELVTGNGAVRWENLRPDARGYLTVYTPKAEELERLRVLDARSNRLREYRMP